MTTVAYKLIPESHADPSAKPRVFMNSGAIRSECMTVWHATQAGPLLVRDIYQNAVPEEFVYGQRDAILSSAFMAANGTRVIVGISDTTYYSR